MQRKANLMIRMHQQDESLTIKAFNQMQDIIIVADIIGDLDALAITLIRNSKSCQVSAKT
jgi:hypothetical protein